MTECLLKGYEIELFTGLTTGEHVGVSEAVTRDFSDFVKEPDQRNLEYVTVPEKEYRKLKECLLEPRRKLRNWLTSRNLTILPGSTLNLGNSKHFERSDLSNSYHEFIELNYGTNVVTTSVHINLGIENLPLLFSALRLVRCEAALFLSLSASSPFLDGALTGCHSQRWIQFPRTPKSVPMFLNHSHYVSWVEDQLKQGLMHNERHLWTSVRPNGPSRPYALNRLELRICDLITDCDLLLAVTALLELRVLNLINDPDRLDPLLVSKLTPNKLSELSDQNEDKVAKASLDALLHNWLDGEEILCRDWIAKLLEDVTPLAEEMNLLERLSPIDEVLKNGNQSMKWIKAFSIGQNLHEVLKKSMNEMVAEELHGNKESVI